MPLPVRISTSPPSFTDTEDGDMSLYCDLHEVADWRSFTIARSIPTEFERLASRAETIAYVVRMSDDREIGLLFCYEDDEDDDWLIYRGFDCFGGMTREPAANEALWRVANVGLGLAAGHRLARVEEDAGE